MKRFFFRALRASCVASSVFMLSVMIHADSARVRDAFLFDSPFPACTYKKLLDASVGVWGYLQMLQENDLVQEDIELFCDAIVGRITQIPEHTDLLVDECYQGIPLLTDDVVHLITIFNGIDNLYQEIPRCRADLDKPMELLSIARNKLKALMYN